LKQEKMSGITCKESCLRSTKCLYS
jgi:hypothetical protein